MADAAAAAIAECPRPLYNTYAGGGPIIWLVPSQLVFVDSRQDHLPAGVVAEATEAERSGDPTRLFEKYRFRCAAVPPSSPIVRALTERGWRTSYADDAWAVLIER
jgi:hypothetical protein